MSGTGGSSSLTQSFPCREPNCNREFNSKSSLADHSNKVHGGGSTGNRRPKKCTMCSSTFGTRSGLRQHEKNVHLLLTYDCLICGTPFTSLQDLTSHQDRMHKQ
ncbi:hypothetical protein BWQ96_01953 [Gracilariopsis chorda]|uniref:C2H2-type domain-containing protein n=1 Tax=Gracilariopsis chorda TaxID=448386 RepID=A0A2V3J1K5_9FLOR|nr:hypothetical protein BWQ96_01953 [Gracilariopsis chorda]|eukprot:PXF48264.1 hypothetical protein BWQ96_01953 [Gracilariopsis chorda]